ncbi:MAG TPA: DNA topoisomerase I [Rhodanobacteraceae bacterium]|nr:DNA topoisomerase I [Rhodanobacteraceae bacterium]
MAKNLLIVESPAKAKTINKYLGADFKVLASYGHVRDLVPKEGAVDTEHDFAMDYALIEKNVRHVDDIAKAAKAADSIYLATDLDREGEAISWHISEILKQRGLLDGKETHRVVFSEITPRAIKDAVAHPRGLSHDLVDAQQARRALDYLVGFNLSPVLWRKVQRGLSAGRVQSPALRMIVEREEEIEAFKPREYWSVEAKLAHEDGAFSARLVKFKDKKFEQFDLTNANDAHAAREALLDAAGGKLTVGDIQSKQRQRRPAAPFTTSTLQQEAARKLGMATSRTMRIAQGLYEGVSLGGENVGLITYMRTDSTHLSGEAVGELRTTIEREFGKQGLPEHAMVYKTKSKNAQEAHEAIRPTSALRTPKSVAAHLTPDQLKVYELIWKRAVACQMKPATLNTVAVEFPCGGDAAFRATGTTVVDPGFLAVYEEGRDQKGSDDDDEKRKLPALAVGETVPLTDIATDQHFTEPPPRYSEASLVKTLEEYGIGRPSTYASIIQTLLSRDYVTLDSRRFKPTDVGRAVANFLTAHFTRYVDYDFTAKLEDELDAVSRGEEEWRPLMAQFWKPFKALVEDKMESVDRSEATGARLLGDDPKTGKPVSVRLGRYGPYAALGDKDTDEKLKFASLLPGQSMHTITLEEALELFKLPRTLGVDGDGEEISAGIGRFGPFVKKGKLYASLKGEDNAYTVTLERAQELIREKQELIANRVIHDFGDGIQVLNGRYGPYITNGEKNARVPKERDPKSLGHDECKALLDAAPVRRGRGAFKKTAAKKAAAKKAPTKKAATGKKAAKKSAAKKSATKKTTARKSSAKKSAARKTAAKKASGAATESPPFDV